MARGGDGGGGGGGGDSKGGTGAEDVVCADGRCEWSAIEPAGCFGSISCQIRTHDKRATARRTSGTRPVGGISAGHWCCEDSETQKASKAHTLRNPSTGAAIAWTEVDRHSLLYRFPLRGPRRRDSRSDRDPNAQAGVNALTETTSIHTQGVITRLAVACESRGSGSLPLSK